MRFSLWAFLPWHIRTESTAVDSLSPMSPEPLLDVRDLAVRFSVPGSGGWFSRGGDQVRAVDGVSFSLARGETLGLVGESGCGKSTTGRAVLQLLRPAAGSVIFDGQPLHEFWQRRGGRWRWDSRLQELRQRMQMIFQDPFASLNPRMTVEAILAEPLRNFAVASGGERRERIQQLLETVGMDPRALRRYPHEFSGGQRQRIGIARALALGPELIVADEPISALDVSIQAQIINLLKDLQKKLNLSLVFIAHDMSVVRHISDRIMVMYLGRAMEISVRDNLYKKPLHPYTSAMIRSVPVPDPKLARAATDTGLKGDMPSPLDPPPGCVFHSRCPFTVKRCQLEVPALRRMENDDWVACHRAEDLDLTIG